MSYQTLPQEIRDNILINALNPQQYDLTGIVSCTRRVPLPLHLRQISQEANTCIRDALSTQWLWILFRVKTCDRSCRPNESVASFDTWYRKLRYQMRVKFDEERWIPQLPTRQLSAIASDGLPIITVTMVCCGNAKNGSCEDSWPELNMMFAAGPLINEEFSSLLCKITASARGYTVGFGQRRVVARNERLRSQGRTFMLTMAQFVRDVPAGITLDPVLTPRVVHNPNGFINYLSRSSNVTAVQGHPPDIFRLRDTAARLEGQHLAIQDLQSLGFPAHFMLPWVLDTMTTYREQFDRISRNYNRTIFIYCMLTQLMGRLMAQACSGLAERLLGRPNTRASQRHYTMPNRFYDPFKFNSGEYFWLRLIDRVSAEHAEWDVLRNKSLSTDYTHSHPWFWLMKYQGCAELCIAFARAAFVVGDDDYSDQARAFNDRDPMPDIRENNTRSRDFRIPALGGNLFYGRIVAIRQHLARASEFLRGIHELRFVIPGDQRDELEEWMDVWEERFFVVQKAFGRIVAEIEELGARAEEARVQAHARQRNDRVQVRGSKRRGVTKLRRPKPRRPKAILPPNEELLEPMISVADVQWSQNIPRINYTEGLYYNLDYPLRWFHTRGPDPRWESDDALIYY